MRKLLLLAVIISIPALGWTQVANVYVAQSSAGGDTGANCANAHAVSFFNTSSNWGSGGAQIGSGTTVHLCGTFTGSAGQTMLTTQGNGASGNPVTILFESGALLTSPQWAPAGGIIVNHNFITIDGGTNGVIRNTLNGTSGGPCIGGGCSIQSDSRLIFGHGTDLTVKNITLANAYVHSSTADGTDWGGTECVVSIHLDNLIVDHVTCHDAGTGIDAWGNNITVSNSTLFNCNRCITFGSNLPTSGVSYHDNHMYGHTNWDNLSNAMHHDGIHMFPNSGSANASSVSIYNNLFEGGGTINNTAHVYLEGAFTNLHYYNNVCNNNTDNGVGSNFHMPCLWLNWQSFGLNQSPLIVNNTFLGGDKTAAGNIDVILSAGTRAVTLENNVITGGNILVDATNSVTFTTINNNVYENTGTTPMFNLFSTGYSTFSAWKAALPGGTGQDSASVMNTLANLHLTSDGHLQSGSPAISEGLNLTSLGITSLNSDKAAIARPSSGAWDAGAYQSASGSCSPLITGLTLNPTSVVSGNTSTGTITISCAPSANTDVAISSNNTSAASAPTPCTVLANQTSCSFTITTYTVPVQMVVTFTATLGGSVTAQLTVNPPPAGGAGQGGGSKVSGSAKVG